MGGALATYIYLLIQRQSSRRNQYIKIVDSRMGWAGWLGWLEGAGGESSAADSGLAAIGGGAHLAALPGTGYNCLALAA